MASYSPPLDQLLPTMHAVVHPLASALCVFFFGTQHGRNTWVHYLAAHRTATHRRVRPSMVVVWALLDVSRHFIVRPLTLASPRPGPAQQSARPEIRWSRKPRLPFRSHGQQRHNGLPYYSTDCDDENSKFRSPSPAKDSCTNADVKQGVTRVSYSPRVRTPPGVAQRTEEEESRSVSADPWKLPSAYRCSPVSCQFTPNVAPGSVPAMNVSRIAPAAPGSVTAPVIGSTEVKTMLAGGTNRSAVSCPSM